MDRKNRERVALTQLMIYVTVDGGEERDSSTKPSCQTTFRAHLRLPITLLLNIVTPYFPTISPSSTFFHNLLPSALSLPTPCHPCSSHKSIPIYQILASQQLAQKPVHSAKDVRCRPRPFGTLQRSMNTRYSPSIRTANKPIAHTHIRPR